MCETSKKQRSNLEQRKLSRKLLVGTLQALNNGKVIDF